MRQIFSIVFLALLCKGCQSPATGEFTPKSPARVQSEIESFLSSHKWQKDERNKRPVIAVTPAEIKRLKAAWSEKAAGKEVLAKRFSMVDRAMEEPLVFPPEGGQHNQWYQCTDCQIGLRTIDDHHHKCPQCRNVYSGFPYDNVIYSRMHSHNINVAEDAAWAWAVTGDRKYAEFAARILLGYAERYLRYPMVHASVSDKSIDVAAEKTGKYQSAGHIKEQTLDEANLMVPVVTAYDLIQNSGVLSRDEKENIEKNFIRAMADCINVYKSGKSNWQTWHNTALMYAGLVLTDRQMVEQALLDKDNGFITQMNISVMPEGMWYENSWGYHYYTLSALTHMAEAARRSGIDIYSHEMLHKMYLIAFDYLMSDGSLPRFGDSVNDTPGNPAVNEMAYMAYSDDRLLFTLPSEISWDMIMSGRKADQRASIPGTASRLIPGAGHAILATEGPGQLTAALTFGPYGGFHGHFDKLSFVFFGYGSELGVDPGRAASQAYRLPIHSEWYKATTGHNAILADGESQKEAEGKLISYAASPLYAAVAADAGPAFEKVNHRRFLLLAPEYLLVVDELNSLDGKEHTFDWLYHNKGIKTYCNLTPGAATTGNAPAGYTYLKDIDAFKVGKEKFTEIRFQGDQINTRLIMAVKNGDEVFTATGPLASVTDRAPMAIVRRKGDKVLFASAIEPVPADKESDIRSIELVHEDTLEIIIGRASGTDRIKFGGKSPGDFKVFSRSGSSAEQIVLDSATGEK